MLSADTVFKNGRFLTLDANQPAAQALAVLDGKILAIGTNEDLDTLIGTESQVVDLEEQTVVPGFHDAHCHILLFGLSLLEVNVRPATTVRAVVDAVAEHVCRTEPSVWVRGGGYNENNLEGGRHPTRHDFDTISPHNPVWLSHISGHMGVANSHALEIAGITRETADPEGGHIVKDEQGKPTGLLLETAQELVKAVLPPYTMAEIKAALALAGRQMAAEGITSVQDAWGGWIAPEEFRAYQEATAEGLLPQRVRLMVDVEKLAVSDGRFDFAFGLHTGFGNDRLRLGAIKIFNDGSLAGRTAALSQPYADPPDTAGFLVKSAEVIHEQIRLAYAGGWQVAMHAIGDKAIEVGLDAIEAAMGSEAARFRPRLEHCGILRPDLIKRIRRLGVVVVTQPRFITELGDSFRTALGKERLRLTYPFASLRGLHVAFSSDRPVVDGSPLLGIVAAVTEKTSSGAAYVPEEAISIEEALRWYTFGSAYSTFEENEKGTLSPGKWADFVVLDGNPIQSSLEELANIHVLKTVVGGEIIFEQS